MDEQIGISREGQTGSENAEAVKSTAFVKLCVSLVLLGTALLLRVYFPEQTRDFLQKNVSGGLDYTAVFGELGGNIRSFVFGVPHPDEIEGVHAQHPDAEGDTGSAVREEYDPENEPPPEDPPGIGGFDMPILWMNDNYFEAEFGEDDTFPLPFGMQKPERVDYTVYELPFETVMPAGGRISSYFGYRIHPVYGDWRFHYGIDIAAGTGTPILAFADGTVSAAGTSRSYGNYVILRHDGDFYTLYAHCSTVDVKAGQKIERGQRIAAVGSTGVTTGPHLHFELRYGDAFLDPSSYLEP